MSKYDFEIDLSINTSTGWILNKIKAGSLVLEFGCAAGRMTRYMKEVLGCRVYIVEYDERAYKIALDYAEDGLCDDILNFKWVENFKNIKFDAIIFADVLEHLIDPKGAVENARTLLKDSGKIYISIPNITHNDILLKAYDERFDYTKIGLLDDTHIHFWGLKNIEKFAEECGLHVNNIEATYCATGYTEQYEEAPFIEDLMFMNKLHERQCGEVYQFLIALGKQERSGACISLKRPTIKSHIYLDFGEGFNEKNIIEFESEYFRRNYIAHYVIENTNGLRQIRFDPLELQGCIIQYISICQDGKEIPFTCSDHVMIESGILLLGNDPMIFAEVLSQESPIVINADILILGDKYVEILNKACVSKHIEFEKVKKDYAVEKEELYGEIEKVKKDYAVEKEELYGEIEKVKKDYAVEKEELYGEIEKVKKNYAVEKEELYGEIEKVKKNYAVEKKELQKEIQRIIVENEGLQEDLKSISTERERLQTDLGAYIILVNNKDKLLIEKEKIISSKGELIDKQCKTIDEQDAVINEKNRLIDKQCKTIDEQDAVINEKNRIIDEQDAFIKNKEMHIMNVEGELYYYKNLPVMRFRFFLIRIWRGVKKHLRKLVKKKES